MKNLIDYFYIFIIALVVVFYTYPRMTYNWDFIGYMGVVIGYKENNIIKVHDKTYNILKKSIDIDKYQLNSEGYRKTMSNDAAAFAENLSYYKIRPIYTGIIFVLFELGVPMLLSIKLVSIIPIFVLLIIFYLVLKKEMNKGFFAFILSLLILFSPLVSKLGTTTPDSLSALFFTMLSLSYYYKKNKLLLFLLMLFLIGIRTDNIIFLYSLLFLDSINKFSWRNVKSNMIFVVILFIFYLIINISAGNGGFWIVFYNTLVQRLDYPLTSTPKFNFQDYFFGQNFALKYTIFTLIIIVFIGILGFFNYKMNHRTRSTNIIFAVVLTLIGRLIFFPAYNSRYMLILFFIPFFILLIENKAKIKDLIYRQLFLKFKGN